MWTLGVVRVEFCAHAGWSWRVVASGGVRGGVVVWEVGGR